MFVKTASYDNLTSAIVIRTLIKNLPVNHPTRKALEGVNIILQENEGTCMTHLEYPEPRFEVTNPSEQVERAALLISDMIFLCRLASKHGFDLQFFKGLPVAYDTANNVFLPFGFHFKKRSNPKTSELNTIRQVVRDIGNPYYEALLDIDKIDIDKMLTHILHVNPNMSKVIDMQNETKLSGDKYISLFFNESNLNDVLIAYTHKMITRDQIERLTWALHCI